MYQLDENYLDQKYFLRPIDDNQQWNESEKKLQTILRKASNQCYEQKLISKEERDEFHISGSWSLGVFHIVAFHFSHCTGNLSCFGA